jgi:hypothetical protein
MPDDWLSCVASSIVENRLQIVGQIHIRLHSS